MCRFLHIVTMKEGWECKQGTGALDNNPVTTYSLHMKGRHHGHKPWILIQNMDSAQSKFINPIHSVVTVQLHWSLKNAWADSPGAHCISGRSGFTKEDETEAAEPICMNVGRSESTWEGKTKALHESRRAKRLLLWPGFSAQPGEPFKSHLWLEASSRRVNVWPLNILI